MKTSSKAFSVLFASMLIVSALAVGIPITKADPATNIMILPQVIEFGPEPCVGELLHITCEVFDVTNLYGVDIQIKWDTNWIKYINHTKHIPINGIPPYPDGILYKNTMPTRDDVDETASMPGSAAGTMYWLAEASMSPAAAFTGNGTAFDMWFNVTAQPGVGEDDAVFQIAFTYVILSNQAGSPISHTKYPATVTIHALPVQYPPKPKLSVIPDDITGDYGEFFTVDIVLSDEFHGDLDPFWDPAGFDMVLNFNSTLIEGISVDVDPDGWFASFWDDIFVIKDVIDNGAGTVWIAFLGYSTGTHTAPYGQGRLAEITFNATFITLEYPPESCPLELEPTTIAGFPHPERDYAPWYGLEVSVPLPHVVNDGLYTVPRKTIGRAIDIYTCYPSGYDGTGPGEPSDLVWPQKSLCVCANVSYNEWPEQNKDVAFLLLDNHGEVWAIYYNRTNSDGVACIFIRMPWVCDDPEYYIGEWTIIATVDVACTVVNDTLTFKYDYYARIWEEETFTDKASYKHTECINVTISYGTYWMQEKEVMFTVTAVDETGVPFGWDIEWVWIGGAEYCTYENGTVNLLVCIPKFARAGLATLYIGVMDNWPDGTPAGQALFPVVVLKVSIEAA